jgi:hypothetical protein
MAPGGSTGVACRATLVSDAVGGGESLFLLGGGGSWSALGKVSVLPASLIAYGES